MEKKVQEFKTAKKYKKLGNCKKCDDEWNLFHERSISTGVETPVDFFNYDFYMFNFFWNSGCDANYWDIS